MKVYVYFPPPPLNIEKYEGLLQVCEYYNRAANVYSIYFWI